MQPGNEHPILLSRGQPVSDEQWRAPLPPSNLPIPPNLFIGRVALIEEICNLITLENVRLLTLTGPGGVGKTRIAIRAAERLLPNFEDGAWFVPLAPIGNPNLILSAIANALGIKEEGSTSLRPLLEGYLHDKSLLLVLDNFEQVASAAPQITDLISNAPGVQVIITSRMPLRTYGEHEYQVPLMDLPDEISGRKTGLKWLANYDAVRLFVARAREIDTRFALTAANADAIVAICRRLDCLPLALELAAARLRLFSPQALLSRLGKALPLLTGGARDLTARQQTLRNAIAWSYDLLDPVEQRLFALMSVFVGGSTLDAIQPLHRFWISDTQAVPGSKAGSSVSTRDPQLSLDEGLLLDKVESLISQNLLRRRDQSNSEPRFSMLATIREYAWERLADSGQECAARDAHAAFFLSLAEQFDKDLRGPKQGEWLDRLEREHDNLRAAIQWYLEDGQGEQAARMGSWLWWFWHTKGYVSEGRQWLERVLAIASTDSPDRPETFRSTLAAVYNGAGALAGSQSDYLVATDFLAKSMKINRDMDDKRGLARTLNNMGIFLSYQGAYAEAELCFKESFDLKQEIGDLIGLSSAYNRLAQIAHVRGNYDQAINFYNTSLKLRRERGDTIWIADTLQNMADLYFDLGQVAHCAELANESLALAEEAGYKLGQALVSMRLGAVHCELGEYDKAAVYLDSSLELARSLGDTGGIAKALKGLGQVSAARQDYDKANGFFQDALRTQVEAREYNVEMADMLEWLAAIYISPSLSENAEAEKYAENARRVAHLLGAVETRRKEMGAPISPVSRARFHRTEQAARTLLGQAAFELAFKSGHATPFEQAAMLALQGWQEVRGLEIGASESTAPQVLASNSLSQLELTEREAEVLHLLAAGLTNKDIGENLVLSHRTVQSHLYNIFNKLGVTTRSAATRIAIELGLA